MEIDRSMSEASAYPTRFLVILGAMKAGTTYLYNLVCQHPTICEAYCNEPNYFIKREHPALAEYAACFPGWDKQTHSYALEGSANYTKVPVFPDCAERMGTLTGAEFRFVYIVRDPVERIRSHYRHALRAGFHCRMEDGYVDQHALDISSYAMQLDRYMVHFPRESIRIVRFTDLVAMPDVVTEQILDFLGLNPRKVSACVETNDSGIQYPSWVYALRRRIPTRRSFSQSVFCHLLNPMLQLRLSKRDLKKEHIAIIRHTLAQDVKRLHEYYGVDVSHWKTYPHPSQLC